MDCLTPEVLAAWMDGTLSATERSAAEAHAADCAHCQAMLAAMARTAPIAERRAWWSAPAVRWLVPIGAAALVIGTWAGFNRGELRRAPAPAAVTEVAPHVSERASPPPVGRVEAPAAVADSDKLPEARSALGKRAARGGPDETRRAGQTRIDALSQDAMRAEPAAPAAQPFGAVAPSALPPSTAAPTPAPPPPPAAAAPVAALPYAPPPGMAETVTVTSETAASRKSAAPVASAAARVRPVEVISPERAFRWRTIGPGDVVYSMDGGMSWRPSATGTSVVLHAGSAPSRSVCWFVGQAGTVLLTTDGQNWQVRPFPERIDLTDIHATDARTATVTTANRRRFATTDGGATWSPLQEN